MSIEVIGLEHFSTTYQLTPSSYLHSCKIHSVFHSFLYNNRKQDAAAEASHIKRKIELLKNIQLLFNDMSTVWYNTYACLDHYRCATSLYLLFIFLKVFNINIDRGSSTIGYGRELVESLIATDKNFIFHLMVTVQLPANKRFDTKMSIHTSTHNYDVILSQ